MESAPKVMKWRPLPNTFYILEVKGDEIGRLVAIAKSEKEAKDIAKQVEFQGFDVVVARAIGFFNPWWESPATRFRRGEIGGGAFKKLSIIEKKIKRGY